MNNQRSFINKLTDKIMTCSTCGDKHNGPCPKLDNSISPSGSTGLPQEPQSATRGEPGVGHSAYFSNEHSKEPQSVPWEKEFDKKFNEDWSRVETLVNDEVTVTGYIKMGEEKMDEIKSYIKNLLTQERQALVEKIEDTKIPNPCNDSDCEDDNCWQIKNYNQALSDLLEHLKK